MEEYRNNKRGFTYWREHPEAIFIIVSIIVGLVVQWTILNAQVTNTQEQLKEEINSKKEIVLELKGINEKLNNQEYGLPVLNQRIKRLENRY